jgi:hypothetical protein
VFVLAAMSYLAKIFALNFAQIVLHQKPANPDQE